MWLNNNNEVETRPGNPVRTTLELLACLKGMSATVPCGTCATFGVDGNVWMWEPKMYASYIGQPGVPACVEQ